MVDTGNSAFLPVLVHGLKLHRAKSGISFVTILLDRYWKFKSGISLAIYSWIGIGNLMSDFIHISCQWKHELSVRIHMLCTCNIFTKGNPIYTVTTVYVKI